MSQLPGRCVVSHSSQTDTIHLHNLKPSLWRNPVRRTCQEVGREESCLWSGGEGRLKGRGKRLPTCRNPSMPAAPFLLTAVTNTPGVGVSMPPEMVSPAQWVEVWKE